MEYFQRRILISIVVIFLVVNLTFIIPRLAPGNAAEVIEASAAITGGASELKAITARLGLDKPVTVQYFNYMKGIFTTWPPDFGFSYVYYPTDVSYLFFLRLPWTILLIASGFILSFAIAYGMARFSALRRGG